MATVWYVSAKSVGLDIMQSHISLCLAMLWHFQIADHKSEKELADARYTKLVSEFQNQSHENEQMEKGFRELRIRHEEMKAVLEAYRKVGD